MIQSEFPNVKSRSIEMRTRCIEVVLAAFLALTLNACSQTYQVGDGANKATITTDGSGNGTFTVTGTGEDGHTTVNMSTGANAKYPGDFPFAQYPGSNVTMYIDTSAEKAGQSAKTLTLETSDSPEKAEAYYKNWFNTNGWKVNMETNTAGMCSIAAQQGEVIASIMCMPGTGGQKNSIQIMLSYNK